jgi:phytoene synthase
MALYAVYYEIARTAEAVREAALGPIRLAWWRDALAQMASGNAPHAHPALAAYAAAMSGVEAPQTAWGMIIEARSLDFILEPFADWADIEAYIDATAGNLMRLAFAACEPHDVPPGLAGNAARAWGYIGLLRAQSSWRARGRNIFPRNGGTADDMRDRAALAYTGARAIAKRAPSALFPAFGYAALTPGYLRALQRGQVQRPLLARQFNLIAAAAGWL